MKRLLPRYGFTLVELLIVVGLISILVTIAIGLLNPASQMQKALDAQRKSDLGQIKKALELYYFDHQVYPDPALINFGGSWGTYAQKIPNDPFGTKNYAYRIGLSGQAYFLYASLDRGATDPQACNAGAVCVNAGGLSCGSGVCNYGVTSSNVTP